MGGALLARGMGSFFKKCACGRPARCPHNYTVRYRDLAGRQREESGYATQQTARDRLVHLYTTKCNAPAALLEERRRMARMTFAEYTEYWRTRQRHLVDYSTGRKHRSHLTAHLYPELGDHRMESISPLIIERFITGMERRNIQPGTQRNVYGLLRTVLLDAVRKGAIATDPTLGIKTRDYHPPRSIIPTVEYATAAARTAHFQLGLMITMMRGCGLRNGEARAINVNNVISDDVYRVTCQIHHNTYRPAPLKHRRPGEFRDVPLPRSVKEAIERFEQQHGTTDEGYLLRGPNGFFTYRIESTRAAKLHTVLPPPDGMTLSGYRDLFASVCLEHGIPITDVSEWLGHRKIETTYRAYRHVMPGSLARARQAVDRALAT